MKTLFKLTLALGLFLYVGVKAPDLHEKYLIHTVGPSVVMLTPIGNPFAGGTAFQLNTSKGKFLISNAHVCKAVGEFAMATHLEGQQVVKVLKYDDRADLCLLSPVSGLDGLDLASDKAEVGDTIAVLGHPALQPQTLSKGRVVGYGVVEVVTGVYDEATCTGPGASQVFIFCLQPYVAVSTNALIYGGNSGSPVFNIYGDVLGVIFASDNQRHHGVYVPLSDLQRFTESARDGL